VHGTRKTCASLLPPSTSTPRHHANPAAQQIAITMEVYTEAPSEATRDVLHRLGDMLA